MDVVSGMRKYGRWVLDREYDEYEVIKNLDFGAKKSSKYRLIPKDNRRLELYKEDIHRFYSYLDVQLERLPLLENANESDEEQKSRYLDLYWAAKDFCELDSSLKNYRSESKIEDVLDAWSVFLECLYKPGNACLRSRFIKTDKYLRQISQERRKITIESKATLSAQYRKSFQPVTHTSLSKELRRANALQQMQQLKKSSHPSLSATRLHYDMANKTLYLENRTSGIIDLRFDDLSKYDIYFEKPRVRNKLTDTDLFALKEHQKIAQSIVEKQEQGSVDLELATLWLRLYELWKLNKRRYRKFRDDIRNNPSHYK